MILQGLSHTLLLGTVFLLEDVLGFCERPSWSNVAWDMTTQDLEQLLTKEQSNCLHSSVCQICNCITGMRLSKGCLEILHMSCIVALIIVAGLSIIYILPKLKLIKSIKPCQAMIQTPAVSTATEANDEYSQSMDKMLYKLVANTSKMMKYMKHVARHHKKEVKYHKLRKKRKTNETDEDEQVFQCPYNHSSSEDT